MTSQISRVWSRIASLLPARTDLAEMGRDPRRDLLAGLTVAIVALPLALGFGVSSGLGAEAGLATAVVAGALAALFGGSNLQVSGPTGAMTVVLVPIVGQYGPGGVLTVGLMAGMMLVALAALRAGKYMQYVPAPVVEGFTLGIACVIGLQQIPNALGVPKPEGDRVLVVTWRAVEEDPQGGLERLLLADQPPRRGTAPSGADDPVRRAGRAGGTARRPAGRAGGGKAAVVATALDRRPSPGELTALRGAGRRPPSPRGKARQSIGKAP